MFDFIRKPLLWEAWERGLADEIEVGAFELKSSQDLAVYRHLRELTGQDVAEVGAGHSRILPALAKANKCVAVDKFEGAGGGPTQARAMPDVAIIPAYLGNHDPLLPRESFDVVFSISVVEHVPWDALDAFHADQLRVLKPGGFFLHAIDLYLEDDPATDQVRRFVAYRDWVQGTDEVEPVGSVYQGPCRFTCDLATNPDHVMYAWGRAAPNLIGLRQEAQCVSLLVAGRKRSSPGAGRGRLDQRHSRKAAGERDA